MAISSPKQDDFGNEQFIIHSLPDELLLDIITLLSVEDRRTVRAADKRFNKLEQIAGRRRFNFVFFDWTGRSFEGSTGQRVWAQNDQGKYCMHVVSVDDGPIIGTLVEYFKWATTRTLHITGSFDERTEPHVTATLRTISYDALVIELQDHVWTSGLIKLMSRRCIKNAKVVIRMQHYYNQEEQYGTLRTFFSKLPVPEMLNITWKYDQNMDIMEMEDDIFLRLAFNSRIMVLEDCVYRISTNAFKKVLEDCFSSRGNKRSSFKIHAENIDDYTQELQSRDFIVKRGRKRVCWNLKDGSARLSIFPRSRRNVYGIILSKPPFFPWRDEEFDIVLLFN